MNGNNLLLDTNAIIYFLEGRQTIKALIAQAPTVYFSPISEIELLSAPWLDNTQRDQIHAFLSLCERIDLTAPVVEQAIRIRRQHQRKIPDAIIAASAIVLNIPLVTADKDFQNIESLTTIADILS